MKVLEDQSLPDVAGMEGQAYSALFHFVLQYLLIKSLDKSISGPSGNGLFRLSISKNHRGRIQFWVQKSIFYVAVANLWLSTNWHEISLDSHFIRCWSDVMWVQFLQMFVIHSWKTQVSVTRTKRKNIAQQNTVATDLVHQ